MVTVPCTRCGSRVWLADNCGAVHCPTCGPFKPLQPSTTTASNTLRHFLCKDCGVGVFTNALPVDKRCFQCLTRAAPPVGTPVAAPDKAAPLTAERFAEVRQRVLQATHSLVMSKQQSEALAELCLIRGRAGDSPSACPKPHRCPVCEGRGNVPVGFYTRASVATGCSSDQCRSCKGAGLVWG